MRLLDEAHLRVLSEGYLHQASCRWRRLHSRDVAPSCARRRTRPRFHLSMVLPKDVAKRRPKSGGYAAAAPRRRPRCSSLLASQVRAFNQPLVDRGVGADEQQDVELDLLIDRTGHL